MKKMLDFSHAGTAKMALIVVVLYAIIATVTYFAWK
jgi:hypothetical protein